jgi:hypothetical protein
MKQLLSLLFVFAFSWQSYTQNVYKTPSGKRYHLSSCRMVKNVSQKLSGQEEIKQFGLTPCKICKPPPIHQLQKGDRNKDKSVGTSRSVRCKGMTKKGKRCKRNTKLANGYCFQHTKQAKTSKKSSETAQQKTTSICGARTKSGKACRRKVKGGGYCYQHR